jgi:hypothetical protein
VPGRGARDEAVQAGDVQDRAAGAHLAGGLFDDRPGADRKGAATTGHVVWSWIGAARWSCGTPGAKHILPDEIVDALFETYETYRTRLGRVEEDGLNEFLMQPIRQEQVRRGVTLPLKAVRGADRQDRLHPRPAAVLQRREVIFAKPLPDLQASCWASRPARSTRRTPWPMR